MRGADEDMQDSSNMRKACREMFFASIARAPTAILRDGCHLAPVLHAAILLRGDRGISRWESIRGAWRLLQRVSSSQTLRWLRPMTVLTTSLRPISARLPA